MHYADPVTFYSTLSSYRTMEYAQTATWVLTEPAEMLFSQAGSLIFTGDRGKINLEKKILKKLFQSLILNFAQNGNLC